MNKQEQAILELNSQIKATVGVSKIHGVGVIAITDIQKGEQVYANQVPKVYRIPYGSIRKLNPEVRKIILDRWPSIINGGIVAAHDVRLTSLMNHSLSPNYDPVTDTAKCDILSGEELTENYCEMENATKVFPWLICPTSNIENPESSTLKRKVKRLLHLLHKRLK